jgi:hypothetical protein
MPSDQAKSPADAGLFVFGSGMTFPRIVIPLQLFDGA